MKTEDMKKIIKALENPGIPVEGYHFKNHEWIQTAEVDLHRFNDFRIKPPNIVPDGYEWTGEVRPPVKGEESIIIGTVNSAQFSVSSDHLYFNWGDCQGCRYILKRSTANPGQAISNECGSLIKDLQQALERKMKPHGGNTMLWTVNIVIGHLLDTIEEVLKETPDPTSIEFRECPLCAARPGTPALCNSCHHNRAAIAELKKKVIQS